jgi:magnesium transporter
VQTATVMDHASREFIVLQRGLSVAAALDEVRGKKGTGAILYFYVVDEDGKLVGVLPTRALLTAPPDAQVETLMVKRLVALPQTANMEMASELFIMHRFLAIPIVDEQKRMVGVIDVSAFSNEVLDIAERKNVDTVFESIGLRVSEARDANPVRAFRLRFPWLLATITTGTGCALLASFFGATLAESIVLAFFLTLVLGLGESVAAQSMTLTVQMLRTTKPTMAWFAGKATRELSTAVMLGLVCGAIVGGIVFAWHQELLPALAIGGSILCAIMCAALLGLGVPSLLHALKLDPRVAAGPLTLGLSDLATLAIYFSIGAALL